MAEVILIYPKSSFIEIAMKAQYLPLCLLQAAIYVEKEFEVKIIDQRIDRDWENTLRKSLKKDTLCVGITALTGEMITYAVEVSALVKEISDVPVVWGGVHPTILPEQTLQNKNIDMLVIGEGEITFYELVKSLKNKKSLDDIPGIAFKKDGNVKINEFAKLVDLNELPEPPYHLVDIKNYIIKFANMDMFTMETSRGCPYKCAFCYSTSFGFKKKWRPLSAEKTINRIKYIKETFNVDGIEITDDNFLVHANRAKEIFKGIKKEGLDLFLNINARIDNIVNLDNGNLQLFEQSNVRRLAIGIESGSQKVLDMIEKDIKIEQILDFKRKIDKTNVPPYYNFIGGFPGETEEDLRQSTHLMLFLLKGNPMAKVSVFHCFRPLPGTKLTDICRDQGLDIPDTLEGWAKYSMTYIDHPWINKRLRKMIQMVNFVSLFLDKKYEEVDSMAVTIFAKLYKPIAHLRLKKMSIFLFVEHHFLSLYEKIKKLVS